ncbi:MAG: TerB N-terminal domain-containing protein [Synergistaceae bacterium]|jgi:hypothetical protein|nr:TerB N-terminal domain-containing protein [Synergistaceae bacterium]
MEFPMNGTEETEGTGSGPLEVVGAGEGTDKGLLWLGEGTALRFRDATAAAPMTYCSAGTLDEREASCVYTRLEVRLEKGLDDLAMGYWPTYSEMKPHQRGYYLRWLTTGRKDPVADIGYVFVYFYGLERRALLEKRDIFPIIGEVERLLELYNGSRSFQSHAGRFLLYLHAKYLNSPRMTEKHLANLYRFLPASEEALLSRLVLGYRALRNVPLSAEQAFNLLRRRTARGRRTNVQGKIIVPASCSLPENLSQLKDLFTRRYHEVFSRGFSLSASFDGSKQHSVGYSVASGTLSLSQNIAKSAKSPEPAIVPNVFGKQTPSFKKLRALYEACAEECSVFSKGGDGPVVVRPAGKKPPGEPLPLIPIDMERVEALKEETENLTKELAGIFDSFESEDVLPPQPPEDAPQSLPARYRACVEALLERTEWSKEEFADLARRHGSMPNALLEDLNVWSIEALGDLLLLEEEEEGGWTVNRDLQVPKFLPHSPILLKRPDSMT